MTLFGVPDNKRDGQASTSPVMKVSFIIPTYNTLALTTQCIESLRSTVDLKKHEVIIVDDNSSDGTREYLQSLPATYKIIYNAVNQGYARNCNAAAKEATGDFLCLCNSDLIFLKGWLGPLLKAFEKSKSTGFVGNIQRRVDNNWIDHAGVYFLADGMPLHVAQNKTYTPMLRYLPVSAVTAACCVIRAELFREFGGFDEKYLNGFEDTDLCLRLKEAGYQHYVATRSTVLHHISSSPGRKAQENENRYLFAEKWQSVTKVIAAKEETCWHQFHRVMDYPSLVRWFLHFQKNIRLY